MKFICITTHYWGSGATPAEAKKNCKAAGGTLKGHPRIVFLVEDDEAYVHEIDGSIVYRRGTECRVIEEVVKLVKHKQTC